MFREDYDLGALNERAAVVAYLLMMAKELRKRAANHLADSMQNKPDADREEDEARVLTDAALVIEQGRHWRG